jgi:hypothetical protein
MKIVTSPTAAALLGALCALVGCSDDPDKPDSPTKRSPEIILSAPSATMVEGSSQIINVRLKEQPTADVEIAWQTSNAAIGTVSPSTIRFTRDDWSALKPLTLAAPQNEVSDGDRSWRVTGRISSNDKAYAQLVEPVINAIVTDDDVAGFTVAPLELTTTEAGGTANFTIRLNAKPRSSVTVAIVSDDTGEGEASPSAVMFSPEDWDLEQRITVTGKDDGVADGDAMYQIVFIAARSDDAAYNGLRPTPVRVTNTDGVCGNGVTDGAEVCDEGPGGAATACGYGEMSCMICGPRCTLIPGQVTGFCGDGAIQADQETCDGAVKPSCAQQGATYGATACSGVCALELDGCYEVTALALGRAHSCALTDKGGVRCWGDDAAGQATAPAALGPITKLAAGHDTTCGISAAGALTCWGAQAATAADVREAGVGVGFVCWLKVDGSLGCDGAIDAPPAGLTFTALTVGAQHACALDMSGAASCWGVAANGRTTPPAGGVYSALYAGGRHTCGAKVADGTLECWGDNSDGQLNAPANAVFTQVSAGADFTCGRFMDGKLRCWGRALLRDATPPGEYDMLNAGSGHACARRVNREVLCWGDEDDGRATPPMRSI